MSDRSTLKTVLLVLGSAIGGIVLFVAAAGAYLYYNFFTPASQFSGETFPRATIIDTPPPITTGGRYLGAHTFTTGGFNYDRNTVLAAGPGKLSGRVTASGKPVPGLKLRVALNGKVYSQWGTSGADGRYEIGVPYGQYRVDGYSLDASSADAALPGKIDNPDNAHDSIVFTVAAGRDGRALDLDFIDPVEKLGPQGEFSAAQPLIVFWKAYPRAIEYRVQLVEQPDRRNPVGQIRLFEWDSQPKTAGTSINLSAHGIKLKKGYYYSFEVMAVGERDSLISRSTIDWQRPDFQAVD